MAAEAAAGSLQSGPIAALHEQSRSIRWRPSWTTKCTPGSLGDRSPIVTIALAWAFSGLSCYQPVRRGSPIDVPRSTAGPSYQSSRTCWPHGGVDRYGSHVRTVETTFRDGARRSAPIANLLQRKEVVGLRRN